MGACMGAQGCGWVRTVFVPWWWFSDNISSSSCAGVKVGIYSPAVRLCVGIHGLYCLPEAGPMGSSQEPTTRDLQQLAKKMNWDKTPGLFLVQCP